MPRGPAGGPERWRGGAGRSRGASAVLVAALAAVLPEAVPELGIKIPVDCLLFFVNYLAQKRFVY